jgi:diguanylate cyclase (GGDEF)-like protein
MSRLFRVLVLGLLVSLASAPVRAVAGAAVERAAAHAASPVLQVDAGLTDVKLGRELEVLEDPSGALDLAAVRASGHFQPVPASGLRIGFSGSAWWVRVTLHNAGPRDRALFLREAYPLMDAITLWSPRDDGTWAAVHTGDRLPFASRPYAHHEFLFPIELPAGATRTWYLRFASGGPMDITLHLYEPRTLFASLGAEQLVYGAYFGGFLVLVLYNFFICLVVRDKVFFWYLAYAISYGLYFSVFNGLSFQYLWPGSPTWANRSVLVLISSTVVLGLQFTRLFLDTASTAPRLDRVALLLQVFGAAALVAAFFLPYSALIQALALLTVLATALIIAFGTLGLVEGYRPARWFMLAWAFLLIGVVMTNLKNYGLLPHNLLTQNGFQIGSLCEMVLLSLGLASRVSEMERQSRTDALTRVYNRRYFDERAGSELERALLRPRDPLALLLVDIDHFKRFNDLFGHARGDDVLKVVARLLRDGVRRGDVVCRYGGEEFALLLPGTDARQAVAVGEALRRAVAAAKAPVGGPVTVSVGVASTEEGDMASVTDLFHAADMALYEAKAAGRNRVIRARGGAVAGAVTAAGAAAGAAPGTASGTAPGTAPGNAPGAALGQTDAPTQDGVPPGSAPTTV